MKTPKELDALTDVILAYRPRPKSKASKRRARRLKKCRVCGGRYNPALVEHGVCGGCRGAQRDSSI